MKERDDLFQGGCSFYIKNKSKSEILIITFNT